MQKNKYSTEMISVNFIKKKEKRKRAWETAMKLEVELKRIWSKIWRRELQN